MAPNLFSCTSVENSRLTCNIPKEKLIEIISTSMPRNKFPVGGVSIAVGSSSRPRYDIELAKFESAVSDTASETDLHVDNWIIDSIKFQNTIIEFNGDNLRAELSFGGSHFIVYEDKYGVYGFGDSPEEAFNDFKSSFIDFFAEIVDSNPEELGESTLLIRDKFSSYTRINNDRHR
jgi:hypothetical protein